MPPYHRRILFSDDPNHGDCNGWGRYRCYSPPSPPTTSPSPSPADVPSPRASPSPGSAAPAPSPFRHPAAGRRDQGGTSGYGDAAGAGHHRQFVNYTIIAAAAVVFLSLILIGVSVAVRRRQLRRRQALLAPAPAVATNVGNDDPEAGGGGGGVVHHVWYIRTVGLDEAAIDSIAVTRYRAGAGLLGAADCSVCLGEFQDGELVRLLPKCAHAFHVPCIDTWLRAHVNCPLCRSDVLDPAAAAATGVAVQSNYDQSTADPDVNANAAAEQVDAARDSTLEHEDEELENAPHLQEDQQEQQFSTPEPVPQLPCPLPWNVRRAASMDAAIASTAAGVAALDRLSEADPQGEQNGREKHRSGATGHLSNPSTERPTPSGAPRSFFSRHCRARSSVLPL